MLLPHVDNSGVEDVLFVGVDGRRLPEAIESVWPHAIVQTGVMTSHAGLGLVEHQRV